MKKLKIIWINHSGNSFNFRRVENVGPKVSAELLRSGVIAISVALFLMLVYIWIRFEWQFSLGAIVALFHDVIVTLGLFSLLGLEINLSIIAAVLTIVGYSMNDTVALTRLKVFSLNKAIFSSIGRVIVGPIIGYLLILYFNLEGFAAGVLLIQCSMPSAVLNYLVASIYSPKKIVDSVASTIVVSTLMSFITIPIVVFLALKYFN